MGSKIKTGRGTKMGYRARTEYRVRMICALLVTALALTCCPLQSRAEIIETRTWNGFVYISESGFSDDARLEIINYKGTKRELTIPTRINGMRVQGVYSLRGAKNLRTLHIPNGVEADAALTDAPKLKKITVSKSNKRYSVKGNALLNKKGTVLLGYPGGYSTLRIPNSVTRIRNVMDSKFKRIKWGKNVRRIEGNAFKRNRGMQTLTVKGKVEVIGYSSFADCRKLKKVVLGENVRKIENAAFASCYKLNSVYIYNRECEISPPDDYDYDLLDLAIPKTATIYGWKGSTAEEFAKKYKIKFREIERR